jgi:hypothetical protein
MFGTAMPAIHVTRMEKVMENCRTGSGSKINHLTKGKLFHRRDPSLIFQWIITGE